MKRRLLLVYIGITLILVLTCTYLVYEKSQDLHIEREKEQMINSISLLTDILNQIPLAEGLVAIYDYDQRLEMRFTLIGGETNEYGKVLVDTQYNEDIMDNHQYREEIKMALAGEMGFSVRHSTTFKVDFLYVALPVVVHGENMILRASKPLDGLKLLNQHLHKVTFWGIFGALLVAIILYYWFLTRLTRPLDEITQGVLAVAAGDYQVHLPHYQVAQFDNLAGSFNQMVFKRKEYTTGLEEKNAEMAAIFNSVGSALVLLNTQQEIKVYNAHFVRLFEFEKIHLINQKIYQILRKTELTELIESALLAKRYTTKEMTFNLSKGMGIYRVTTAPVVNDAQQMDYGLLLVVEDITQLKSLENMRRDFVANVSHELKTPLTSIRGFIETLKCGAMEDKEVADKFLTIIDLEADRLYRMIKQLLYLSQLENEAPLAPSKQVDLVALTEELRLRFQKEIAEKSIELLIKIEGGEIYQGDGDALVQILLNLLDNALQYSGGDQVYLNLTNNAEGLTCEVGDNGIGIGEVDQKRIFERFYRVDKSRSQKSGGTGLGLAIVKHLVENAQGSLHLSSEIGKGAVFTVKLPNNIG